MSTQRRKSEDSGESAPALLTASDLAEIDLSSVWDEVAASASDEVCAVDELDAFGTRAGQFPELSPESQALLVQAYQQAARVRRALEEGLVPSELEAEARALVARGERCTEYLLGAVFRLVRSRVWERASKRLGEKWAGEVLRELLSGASATVLEAAASFDPKKGPTFASWVVERLDHELPGQMGQHGRLGSMPQTWSRLARIAHHVIPELTEELGRQPSTAEVGAVLLQRCQVWAEEHLTEEQKLLPAEERSVLATEKLKKQGMLKALKELPEIIAAMQPELGLEAPTGEGGGGLGDIVAGGVDPEAYAFADAEVAEYSQVLGAGMGNLGRVEQEMVLTYLGLADGEEWTFRRIAQRYGVPDLQVRHLVRDAEARLKAPHAQYSYLCEDVDVQFEPEGEEKTAVAALKRRGRPRVIRLDEAALAAELGIPSLPA